MGKGYYWIEPVDQTLNDFQFYKARIVGDPEYDERHHRVILRTDKYFPVGSIFHVLKDPEMFVIDRKFISMSLSLVRVNGNGSLSRNLKTRLLYSVADSCTGTAVSDTYPYLPPPRFLGIYVYNYI